MRDFSLWCDFVERKFLDAEFLDLIKRGAILGATSNPAIFENAIKSSSAYKSDILAAKSTSSAKEIYESLAFSDIKKASEILVPLHRKNANNGFISIEIDPNLCDDAPKSIDEGVRIARALGNAENVMIKVPASEAGFEVMSALIARKIAVNATLIFSQSQTARCLEALSGADSRAKAVISVFVSRFDKFDSDESAPKLGIFNAMKCYEMIEARGNPHIRALFASTGTKNAALEKSYYIKNLLLPNAINTAPLGAIRAFCGLDSALDSQNAALDSKDSACGAKDSAFKKREFVKIPREIDAYLARFEVEKIARELLDSGLLAFKESFESMLKNIAQIRESLG